VQIIICSYCVALLRPDEKDRGQTARYRLSQDFARRADAESARRQAQARYPRAEVCELAHRYELTEPAQLLAYHRYIEHLYATFHDEEDSPFILSGITAP
jgi:hypothetical protein